MRQAPAAELVDRPSTTPGAWARPSRCWSGKPFWSWYVRLSEELLLSGGIWRPGRLRSGKLPPPSAEDGVEGLGHDVRGSHVAVSADGGGMIAGPALCVRHDRSLRGKSEDSTIPFPSLSPQGVTVSSSTHNAGSYKAHSAYRTYARESFKGRIP